VHISHKEPGRSFRSDSDSCRLRSLTESRRRVVQNRVTAGAMTHPLGHRNRD
jgi:hypothetical protein